MTVEKVTLSFTDADFFNPPLFKEVTVPDGEVYLLREIRLSGTNLTDSADNELFIDSQVDLYVDGTDVAYVDSFSGGGSTAVPNSKYTLSTENNLFDNTSNSSDSVVSTPQEENNGNGRQLNQPQNRLVYGGDIITLTASTSENQADISGNFDLTAIFHVL